MGKRRFLMVVLLMLVVVFSSAAAFAAPSVIINYSETNLGGSWWQYDYTLTNTSSAREYLYSVFFDFAQESDVVGLALPSGWDGTVWMGANTTDYLDTYSTDSAFDITAYSGLSEFNFKVNYQAGDIPYTAYFDDHKGGYSSASGITAAPEPISSILFLTGGATLAVRRYIKKKKNA